MICRLLQMMYAKKDGELLQVASLTNLAPLSTIEPPREAGPTSTTAQTPGIRRGSSLPMHFAL